MYLFMVQKYDNQTQTYVDILLIELHILRPNATTTKTIITSPMIMHSPLIGRELAQSVDLPQGMVGRLTQDC